MTKILSFSGLVFAVSLTTSIAATILNTDFSDSQLYPQGEVLGVVEDGLGQWQFNSALRAVAAAPDKTVLNFANNSFSYYVLDGQYKSGSIEIEFTVKNSNTTSGMEFILADGTDSTNFGPQVRFGASGANSIAYYDGSNWQQIDGVSYTEGEFGTYKYVAHLDGVRKGTFDFYAGDERIATGLDWRNDIDLIDRVVIRQSSSTGGRVGQLAEIRITQIPEPSIVSVSVALLVFMLALLRRYRYTR